MNLPRDVSLLGFVDDKIDDGTPAALDRLVSELARSRTWTGGPPVFVDEVDGAGVRTLGVLLWLSAAAPPEIDRSELADTEALVDALAGFSRATGLVVGIEYGGDSAGWITAGEPDEMIREVLIGEWARGLLGRE